MYEIFSEDEIIGHNVSGKTFSKSVKNKKPLDENRIKYIREIVISYFKTDNSEDLWKSCRTAINKSIRNYEIKHKKDQPDKQEILNDEKYYEKLQCEEKSHSSIFNTEQNQLSETSNDDGSCNVIQLESNLSLYQMTNEIELVMKKF